MPVATKPDEAQPHSPAGSADGIRIKDLSHAYRRGEERIAALDKVNLDIPAGQFVSLIGASGCGKTTLLDILSGLQEQQTGRVLLAGQPPAAGRRDTVRMFARDALLPWRSAAGNVDFALATRLDDAEERAERVRALLRSVGLADFQDALPAELSQGMRQRVALARTFSLRSRFVMLDEPFGALDALTKIALQAQLIELWRQVPASTVVLVTHDLAEAVALSDRVLVLSPRPGRIVADLAVDLPRPRNIEALQSLKEFHDLVARLWRILGEAQQRRHSRKVQPSGG